MSIINSSTTGHSRFQERKVANRLYIGLLIAVAAALVVIAISYSNRNLNPLKADSLGTPAAPTQQTENPAAPQQVQPGPNQ